MRESVAIANHIFKQKSLQNYLGDQLRPGYDCKSESQLDEIVAEIKMKDLNANSVEMAMEMIRGTARSMGLEVQG